MAPNKGALLIWWLGATPASLLQIPHGPVWFGSLLAIFFSLFRLDNLRWYIFRFQIAFIFRFLIYPITWLIISKWSCSGEINISIIKVSLCIEKSFLIAPVLPWPLGGKSFQDWVSGFQWAAAMKKQDLVLNDFVNCPKFLHSLKNQFQNHLVGLFWISMSCLPFFHNNGLKPLGVGALTHTIWHFFTYFAFNPLSRLPIWRSYGSIQDRPCYGTLLIVTRTFNLMFSSA